MSVADTPEMTPEKSGGRQELSIPTTENKPLRTYSQKGKSNRPASLLSLPPLKPTPKKFTPTKVGVRLERFHTDNANVHREAFGHYGVDDVDELALEDLGETSYVEYGDHITSPSSPAGNSQVSPHSELPGPVDEDGNDPFVLSKRPLACNPKHDRRTGNGMRSLRRRPHLIFNKTEAKGYKQLNLNDEPDAAKSAPTPRFKFKFGDGFSGREAKPNGSNLLTRSGKQSITSPHVGILDLTQPMTQTPGRKRKAQVTNADDNSFISASKKKSRGPLQPKDPHRQAKPNPMAPATVRRSRPVLGEASKAGEEPSAPEPQPKQLEDNAHVKQPQIQATTPKDSWSHLCIPPWNPTINRDDKTAGEGTFEDGDDDEVDLLIVPDTYTTSLILPADESKPEEDGCETRISETPTRTVRTRARSVSPGSPLQLNVAGEQQPSEREFRRVKTL